MTELIDNPPPLPDSIWFDGLDVDDLIQACRQIEAAAFARGVAARQPEIDQARRTSEYWKAEHAAANGEIDALRARIFKLEADRLQIKGAYPVEPSPNT